MAGDEASFVLPSFGTGAVAIILSMDSPADTTIQVRVNGVGAGRTLVGRERGDFTFRVPSQALFRGDNLVTLSQGRGPAAAVRLHRITIRPFRVAAERNGVR